MNSDVQRVLDSITQKSIDADSRAERADKLLERMTKLEARLKLDRSDMSNSYNQHVQALMQELEHLKQIMKDLNQAQLEALDALRLQKRSGKKRSSRKRRLGKR